MQIIIFLFLLCVLIYISVKKKRITLTTTYNIYWVLFCICGVLIFRNLNIPLGGYNYILLTCVILCFGNFCSNHNRERVCGEIRLLNLKSGNIFFIISSVLLMILILLSYKKYGYSLGGISQFLSVSSNIRWMNFGGRSIFEKISMPFIYSTCVMDGYFMAYSLAVRCKYRTKFILLEGGLAILAFFSTGKSLLLWGIFLWIAGFLTGKQVFLNVKIHKKTLKNFLLKDKYKFIVLCLIVILLLMLMMFVRKQRNLTDILESMFSYGFGQMPCFALWFNNIDRAELQYSMGGQVFYGIMDELGFSKLASDNFPLNMELFYLGVFSNIYTVHRCVIEDFGLIGSAFFWLLFGIASGESEKKCIYGQNTLFYTVLICAFYTFIIFSFIISAWHYLTIFLAIILWGMELFYIERVHKVKLVIKGKETV